MVTGIIGKKVGMTQMFTDTGVVIPVTVLEAGPCVVVQRKTKEKDGYEAVQLGLVEHLSKKKINKPRQGHLQRASRKADPQQKHPLIPIRYLREVRLADGGNEVAEGDKVLVSIFKEKDLVTITGISKGAGFTGVMKRWGFSGGRATHGSMFHRAPGSIGASAFPSRVIKGMKGPGHKGAKRITVKNLEVIKVDEEKNLLVVKGAVPGSRGGYLIIRRVQGRGAKT